MTTDAVLQLATLYYSELLELRLQQEVSFLRDKVMSMQHTGQGAAVVQYTSPVAMQQAGGPGTQIQLSQMNTMRRWVSGVPYDFGTFIDPFEQAETVINPEASFIADIAAAVGRQYDQVLIQAVYGTATTGTNFTGSNSSTETWAQAQTAATGSSTGLTVPAAFENGSTATGLTVAKIEKAMSILTYLHVNMNEPRCLVIGPQQWLDLMQQTQVTNTLYRPGEAPINTGYVGNILGNEVIVTDLLPVTGGTTRQCFLLTKRGLHLGIWKDVTNRVSQRLDLTGQPIQIYTNMMIGATRLEPGRIIEIDCGNDSLGGDPSLVYGA